MNAYTVFGNKVHVGIALTPSVEEGPLCLVLGKNNKMGGRLIHVNLHPAKPASYALVVGGIQLMTSVTLVRRTEAGEVLLARAKKGLESDREDPRCLVMLEIIGEGYRALNPVYDIPVELLAEGFEILSDDNQLKLRKQILMILKPGDWFSYFDWESKTDFTVFCGGFDEAISTPYFRLAVTETEKFRARKKAPKEVVI